MKRLSADHYEIKSMHTIEGARRRGIAAAMLDHIVEEAKARGAKRLSLETGTWDYFKPAVEFYRRKGFVDCAPFDLYAEDPNSIFMTRSLDRE